MVRKQVFSREHIFDAALGLISEKGYYGVSIPDIARAAGTATGTIYRYFASKQALFNELFIESKQLFKAYLFRDIQSVVSFEDVFFSVWRSMMLFAEQEPERLRFIAQHYHGSYLEQEASEMVKQFEDDVQGVLQTLLTTQHLAVDDAEIAISIVFGSFYELYRKLGEINNENRPRFEELGQTVITLFVR